MQETETQYQRLIKGGKGLAAELFRAGSEPEWSTIANREYDGCNLFTASRLLGIRKFRKGFWADPDGAAWGYNIPVRQTSVLMPWEPKPDGVNPRHFGFYSVQPVPADSLDHPWTQSLLLNYGEGHNPFAGFTWVLRDYLRHPFPDNLELLLGAAFVRIGPIQFFSNYFALRYYGATTRKGYLLPG